MEQNSYLQTKNYFKDIVEKSEFLNDFVGFFEREWTNRTAAVKNKILQSPTLALFRYELGFDGPDHNTIAVRKIGFAIMINKVKQDDFEAQYTAIHNAEQLALKVLARIRLDSMTSTHWLYDSFLKESVEIKPVELSASEYGVDVLFNIKNKQSLKVDSTDWKDINEVCQ